MSDVIIVGAGLAGLGCALRLQEAGVDFVIVEADTAVGGRVRTDSERGFLFDRGFQVLITAYPEAARVLDYGALDLHHFDAGCMVFRHGELHPFLDPWRHPTAALGSVFAPFGSFMDKLRVARLRSRVTSPGLEVLLGRPELPTREALDREGLGAEIQEAFFRPFLAGIFLESDLVTSSRKFQWVFRMFSKGRAAVPAFGMGGIPAQLAARLPPDRLLLGARVSRIAEGCVSVEDGRTLLAPQIVVATDAATAVGLIDGLPQPAFRGVTNLYYSLDEAPIKGATFVLNGDGRGLVNNLTFISEVSPHYAPRGRTLASVTVVERPPDDDRVLDDLVRQQLIDWFGMRVGDWTLEKVYRIERALPDQPAGALAQVRKAARLHDWLVVAGDWRNIASINGALESGRLAAEAVLERALK